MDSGADSEAPSIEPSAEDIVWECKNIAKVVGLTERQTFHMLSAGHLPAKKIGDKWVASRKKLLAAVLGDAA